MDQFAIWMVLIHGLYFGLAPYLWRGGLFPGICLTIVVGLRTSIVVNASRVTITKKWFFIPYWRRTAAEIHDVWFDGDWGLEEDATGIVVQLGEREVALGSAKTMQQLHAGLWPLTATAKRYREAARPVEKIAELDPRTSEDAIVDSLDCQPENDRHPAAKASGKA